MHHLRWSLSLTLPSLVVVSCGETRLYRHFVALGLRGALRMRPQIGGKEE
jgi:hypothetical protein